MDARVQTAAPVELPPAAWALALVEARQTILPKRLAAPGPDSAQLRQILEAAAHAPDHDRLVPWRFVIVPETHREPLADAFAESLRERDSLATGEQLAQAREKAFRSPLLMLAIARLSDAGEVPGTERIVSAGCAIQNMLLVATAQGFGSALTSGKALGSNALRRLFRLSDGEHALCFISIGSVASQRARPSRPAPETYVTTLGESR